MTCPTVAAILSAAQTMVRCADLTYSKWGSRQELRACFEDARRALSDAVASATGITASGLNIAALKTVFETAKGSAAVVGDFFIVSNTADTTDTVLATAKGSAPAANDMFRWTKVTATETVEYIGTSASTRFDAIDAALAD